jgi:hypothetical protein
MGITHSDYQLMAIPPKAAYDFINQQRIQSVVFGASSKGHIEDTIKLIKI